jgi:hypothetical protein
MSNGLLRWYAPDSTFRRAAGHRLLEHFPDSAEEVWRSTRQWQTRLAPTRPRHSLSVNLMMRYAEWSSALYRAVQEHGMSRAEAGALVETIMTDAYRPVPAAMYQLTRLRSAERETRLRFLFALMTRYFYSPPFVHRHLRSEAGVAFDVTVCPFADYFKDQGLSELAPHAACNLDYCAAHELGIDFVRTQTLAEGAEHCDFRWTFRPVANQDRVEAGR